MSFLGPIYFEKAGSHGVAPYLKAKTLFRWLSWHPHLKVWAAGGRRWSLILLKDDGGEPLGDANEALQHVLYEEQANP